MQDIVKSLEHISLHAVKLVFSVRALETGKMPYYSTSIWRGMFGREIRRRTCLFPESSCQSCHFIRQCGYGNIFEPTSEVFATEFTSNRKYLSPPIVVQAPFYDNEQWQEGEVKELSLIMFGESYKFAYLFIDSLLDISTKFGIGPDRVKFEIETVYQEFRDKSRKELEKGAFISDYIFSETRHWYHEDMNIEKLLINLRTPLRIQQKGTILREFNMLEFLLNCQRRMEYLTQLYGNQVSLNKESIVELSNHFKIIDNHVRWNDWERFSSKQNKSMNLGGITGSLVISGPIGSLLPLLRFCAFTHIGKQTIFGLGQFELYGDVT